MRRELMRRFKLYGQRFRGAAPVLVCRFAAIVGCAAYMLIPADAGGVSAITLRCKFKAGETYTYQTSGQISIPMPNMGGAKNAQVKHAGTANNALNIPVNSTQKIVVVKLESNGNARLEITSTAQAGMPTGQPSGAPSISTQNVTATPLGVLMGAKSSGTSGGADELNDMSGVAALGSITAYLPAKPVSPGDTWSQKVNVPKMPEMATVSCVFEKLTQVGRYKTAHLKIKIVIPVNSKVDMAAATQGKAKGNSKISGSVTMHFDDDFAIQEGRLIKSIGTGSANLTVNQSGLSAPGAVGAPRAASASIKITMTSTLVQ